MEGLHAKERKLIDFSSIFSGLIDALDSVNLHLISYLPLFVSKHIAFKRVTWASGKMNQLIKSTDCLYIL